MIKKYLEYAKNNSLPLEIESSKGYKFEIIIFNIDSKMISFKFSRNGENGQIKFDNIISCRFSNDDIEKKFRYTLIDYQYQQKDTEKIVETFKKYYDEILISLQMREKEDTFNYLNLRKSVFEMIFAKLHLQTNNLLFHYFTKKKPELIEKKTNKSYIKDFLVLLQQSNLSQKRSIKCALESRISIIEGPPGTGKTTTILSIIANQICMNKKVLVVSKNNSAIDNVAEELMKMAIPEIFIRFGNNEVMEALTYTIDAKVAEYEKQLKNITSELADFEKNKIVKLTQELAYKEERLNELIRFKNQLDELKNQQRHLIKRNNAYDFSTFEFLLKKSNKENNIEKIKRKLDRLAEILVKMSEERRIGFLRKILLYFDWKMPLNALEKEGVILQGLIEEKYLAGEIDALERKLKEEKIVQLQNEICEIYKGEYIELSKKFLLENLKQQYCKKKFDIVYEKLKDNSIDQKIKKSKNELIDIFPVILTTVDAATSNFYSFFKNGKPIDCIIIDEASQCDILSAIPLLYLAKQIVIVGDNKQLRAIVNLSSNEINNKVHEDYDYTTESFLSTIAKTIKPSANLLMEHYRCDYKIINYCNRYYYDNQLIIFNEAKQGSMSVIDDDKGKYVETENGSFVNLREIESIDDIICSNIDGKFVITPFKAQAKKLKERYNKKQCGTIHTFQGKGENIVCFCTVLNNIKSAEMHLNGKNNLFTNELINVAVSRAKNRFVLVTDIQFFKKHDENIKNLIEYIEAYGEVIPDKTVCIFDYLYQKMKAYTVVENCDNIYEKTVKDYIDKYINVHPEYRVVVKLLLVNVVTDKLFLDENPEIKQFILNNAHLDFTIYDNRINKPVAVIELDGKDHKKEEQKKRDIKKNIALKHMGIDLWRLKSKVALTEKQFNIELDMLLDTKKSKKE